MNKNNYTLYSDDFRASGEKTVLYLSLSVIAFIFFILFSISVYVILILIGISAIVVKVRQGQLLGNCIKVTKDHQFPKIYSAAEVAANRLSMKIPEVFVKQDPFLNAYALGFFGKKSVVLHSATVDAMSNQELISILGHEFSHIKCKHTVWTVITNSTSGVKIPIISEIFGFIFLWWSRKAEYTADRGGLLASKDLNASISALIKLAVGPNLSKEINFDRLFDQGNQINEDIVSKLAEIFSTHPYLFKRFKNLLLFSKSKPYLDLSDYGSNPKPDYVELFLKECIRSWNNYKSGKVNDSKVNANYRNTGA